MARIRTIKPEFWADEKLSPLDPLTRLVFLGLVSMADDAGRLHDNIKIIDAFIFPNSDDSSRDALAKLSRISRIIQGKTASGQKVIQIVGWAKHQKVDHPNWAACLPELVTDSDDKPIREAFANDSRGVRDPLATLPTTNDLRPTTNEQRPATSAREAAVPTPNDFLSAWNEFVPFARIEQMTPPRIAALRDRLKDAAWRTKWRAALAKVRGSPFMSGGGEKGWKAHVDWFLKPEVVTLILEGKYDEVARRSPANGRSAARLEAPPGKYDNLKHFDAGEDAAALGSAGR